VLGVPDEADRADRAAGADRADRAAATPNGSATKIALVVSADAAAAERGAGAGAVMKVLAGELGGKGGGSSDVAQGAGNGDAAAFDRAVAAVRSRVLARPSE
jgi:alanyl-tRNA synthetase